MSENWKFESTKVQNIVPEILNLKLSLLYFGPINLMVFIFKKFEDKSKKMNAAVSDSLILHDKQIFL